FGDRIEVVSHVPRASMPDVYRRADVLVLPTLFEGSAITVFEALACGLPVITTDHAGSVVRDGVEGFVVPVRDAETLAARIDQLASDRTLRADMAAAAWRRAREYPWSAYRERLVRLVGDWD